MALEVPRSRLGASPLLFDRGSGQVVSGNINNVHQVEDLLVGAHLDIEGPAATHPACQACGASAIGVQRFGREGLGIAARAASKTVPHQSAYSLAAAAE